MRVPAGLPGDTVRWRETGRHGRTRDGVIEAYDGTNPDRIQPPCPHDAACGGCDLAAWAPEARRVGLGRMVAHSLGWTSDVEVVPSPRAEGHRARIKLAVEGGQIGYRGARSHALVPIRSCRIARPELQAMLPALAAWAAACPEPEPLEVELRTDGTRTALVLSRAVLPSTWEGLRAFPAVAVQGRAGIGDPVLRLPVAGLSLRASPDAFFQVNLEANELLVAHVGAEVRAAKAERVLDLYAGIGNLSLPLAASGIPVVAVEQTGAAIRDLRATAEAHGLTQVQALSLDVARFDPSREPYDVALLDPPRAGAGEALGRVLRNRPRRVVYVSCHVPSAARDLKAHAVGYRITAVRAFDLFPETRHVEAVITLDRV